MSAHDLDLSAYKKCPCCSNPWQAATGDFFAKLCETCETDESSKGRGLDRSNMDFDVKPKDNFYLYSNGNWMKNNPIPDEYPSWNSFLALRLKSQEDCKSILDDLEAKIREKKDISAEEMKVALFYNASMDEDAIEKAGVGPLEPVLKLCEETANNKDDRVALAKNLGKLAYEYSIHACFGYGAGPDKSNSEHSIPQIAQGGIRLPDRDYYFDEDKEDQRKAYKKTLALMLTLLDDPSAAEPSDECTKKAEAVYELEKSLAEAHMTKTENRDPHATNNMMSIDGLTDNVGKSAFDFASYMISATGKTAEELGQVNLRNVKALERVAEVVPNTPSAVLLDYLRWLTVSSFAPYMSKAFVNAHFDFYERTLSGTKELKPRWKRAMEFTESALGEALGKLYCAKFFDESSKAKAKAMIEQVRQALEDRLKEVEWMTSDDTRNMALKKMEGFGIKIGYPDKWLDYDPLVFADSDSFLEMVFKSRRFDNEEEIKEMNAPTDKLKWFMTPQTVNAYYHPNLNEIVFPAAILQHPFYDKDADDAVNFGSMGAVIGHEMTHGFDDKGRKFDWEGNMKDWWTAEDAKEYESRVEVMVKQADSFVVHGQAIKGALTSGENIADLGGLRLALRAMTSSPDYQPDKLIDGFTPIQRFFLSWSQCWRQNITKERALQLVTLDPHGPNEMRANGPLSNMAEFHEAFSVTAGDPMFKPPELRVDIW